MNNGRKPLVEMEKGEHNNQTLKSDDGEEKMTDTTNNSDKPIGLVELPAEQSIDVSDTEVENEECSQKKKQKMSFTAVEELEFDGKSEYLLPKHELNKEKEMLEKKSTSGAKENEGTNNPSSSHANKNKSISLKSQNAAAKDAEESSSGNNLPKQLLTVISNLYLNVAERLHLDFTPRCLDDLAFCHRHHYRAELPEAPMTSQAHSLRSALQHYRYVLFINATTDMCHRGEFPGKGIFTKVIELVLVSQNEREIIN